MTTEQKAKAYDEAIERASKLRVQNPFDTVSQMMEHVFLELCESEDEKIRKALVRFHKGTIDIDGIKGEDILAWLEKQGEQKPIDKIQLGKKYKCIASPRYSTFRRGNIYKPVDNFLCNLMNLCYECFEPIEDSEQKPTDEDMKEALRTEYEKGRADALETFLHDIDFLEVKEVDLGEDEPVSNDLEEAANDLEDYAYQVAYDLSRDWLKENATWDDVETAVKLGAQWQKQQLIDKTCEWINLHIGELSDIYTRSAIRNEFLEDFRKAMEERL